jgi:hypothetical protein
MIITIEFSTSFSMITEHALVQVQIDDAYANVDQILKALLDQYPQIEEALLRGNFIIDGKLNAMLISGQKILSDDSVVTDHAHIRVLSQICGG